MSHTYPDPIQGPNSPFAKSFSYEPMPHCPQLVFNQIELRDYFAAAALQGMLADPTILKTSKAIGDVIVDYSYQLADAMLERRKR